VFEPGRRAVELRSSSPVVDDKGFEAITSLLEGFQESGRQRRRYGRDDDGRGRDAQKAPVPRITLTGVSARMRRSRPIDRFST
jgi:hypothetical protein